MTDTSPQLSDSSPRRPAGGPAAGPLDYVRLGAHRPAPIGSLRAGLCLVALGLGLGFVLGFCPLLQWAWPQGRLRSFLSAQVVPGLLTGRMLLLVGCWLVTRRGLSAGWKSARLALRWTMLGCVAVNVAGWIALRLGRVPSSDWVDWAASHAPGPLAVRGVWLVASIGLLAWCYRVLCAAGVCRRRILVCTAGLAICVAPSYSLSLLSIPHGIWRFDLDVAGHVLLPWDQLVAMWEALDTAGALLSLAIAVQLLAAARAMARQ